MSENLPRFPVKASPQSYERWGKLMVIELQKRMKQIDARYANRSSKILAENDLIYEVLEALR